MIKKHPITTIFLLMFPLFLATLITMHRTYALEVETTEKSEDPVPESTPPEEVEKEANGNGGSGNNTTEEEKGPVGIPQDYNVNCGEGVRAACRYQYGYEVSSRMVVNMYDMYGNEILDPLNHDKTFLAGTYVGLNIYEEKTYRSWVTVHIDAKKFEYKCTKEIYTGCARYNWCKSPITGKLQRCGCRQYATTTDIKYSYTGCPAGYNSELLVSDATCDTDACGAGAAPKVITVRGQSYDPIYRDSNDIDAGENLSNDINEEKIDVPLELEENQKGESDGYRYSYDKGTVCMNVKTGKVRYTNDECQSDEYTVEPVLNDDGTLKYWKYFIPLNANSKTGFSIYLDGYTKQRKGICKSYVEKYEDSYTDFIADVSSNKRLALKQIEEAGGCYFRMTIKIPVEQKFYHELEDGITFKGFNFYYKPIDPNNPFPNELTNTSLWYNLNNNSDLDLTKSYDEITYYTEGINASLVRDYNKDNPYTSWSNMNIDGTSKYINEEGVIKRNGEVKYYKLGCGPANENEYLEDGITENKLFQEDCRVDAS